IGYNLMRWQLRLQARSVHGRELDRQGCETTETEVLAPGDGPLHQAEARHATEQRLERDLAFESGQRSSEAKVWAPAEGEVTIVLPADVQAIGVCKPGRVQVGSSHHRDHRLTLSDRLPAHHYPSRRHSSAYLN